MRPNEHISASRRSSISFAEATISAHAIEGCSHAQRAHQSINLLHCLNRAYRDFCLPLHGLRQLESLRERFAAIPANTLSFVDQAAFDR